jgi:hypothetical protein
MTTDTGDDQAVTMKDAAVFAEVALSAATDAGAPRHVIALLYEAFRALDDLAGEKT